MLLMTPTTMSCVVRGLVVSSCKQGRSNSWESAHEEHNELRHGRCTVRPPASSARGSECAKQRAPQRRHERGGGVGVERAHDAQERRPLDGMQERSEDERRLLRRSALGLARSGGVEEAVAGRVVLCGALEGQVASGDPSGLLEAVLDERDCLADALAREDVIRDEQVCSGDRREYKPTRRAQQRKTHR